MPLTLYYLKDCPFCQKVLDYLESSEIVLKMIDLEKDPSAREFLLEKGGKSQVPCLQIQNKFLYESDEIIKWLKKNPK